MKDKIDIGFIGAGNLGRHAILGLIDSYNIKVSDPVQNQEIINLGIKYLSIEQLCKDSDVIFLTIKPNISEEILSQISDYIDDKLIISFIAGKSLKKLEKLLSSKNIIRAMPSLGISNGLSPIAICSNQGVNASPGEKILNNLGRCMKIEESKFDAFTSIFGAGPAYISYIAELLSGIASENGFENSESLIGEVIGGTYEIHNSKNRPSFEKIKSMVASKGGVTEAALKKIESSGMDKVWKAAIQDAIEKSKKLGGN